jgi:Ubiquitin-conjugating enzyme
VLRFQLAFPQNYPAVPPLIIFTNDIFHPLVTPLTTYTYSTSTSTADPVSAGDQERLLPGGLSLRHGFPGWFKRSGRPGSSDGQQSSQTQSGPRNLSSTGESDKASEEALNSRTAQSIFQPPPKDEGSSVEEAHPTIIEVLRYLKDVFEDDSLLDNIPIDAAGNPGAWHAWQAYRRKTKPGKQSAEGLRSQSSTPSRGANTQAKPKPGGWNWDGVWAERVKKAVNNSLAESTLYGGVDGDDIVSL